MNMNLNELSSLLQKLEELRRELYELIERKGLGDHEVLQASEAFDVVLNEYHSVAKEKNAGVG